MYIIFFIIKKKFKIFKGFTNWLKRITRLWIYFLIMIESNLIYLSFNYFLQLNSPLPASLRFFNKLNIVVANLTFFVIFSYVLLFYLLIYRYCCLKQAKTILNNEAKHTSRGYFCESLCRIGRNLMRGFFHSFFMNNYTIQIIGLACSGFLTTIALLVFRTNYRNVFAYILFFAYHLSFFIFDTILAVHYLKPTIF
jgi:hypothetical protein